tara:strand:+ start:94 stop:300 length:207 start_codon:yes stop_codon:yes gene_type:complete
MQKRINPGRSYATPENAIRAIEAILIPGDRYVIGATLDGKHRYTPVVISKSPDAIMYAHRGFGVFITN